MGVARAGRVRGAASDRVVTSGRGRARVPDDRLRRLPPRRPAEAHRRGQRRARGAGSRRRRHPRLPDSGRCGIHLRAGSRHGRDLVDGCRRRHARRALTRGVLRLRQRAAIVLRVALRGHGRGVAWRLRLVRAVGARVARALPRASDPRPGGCRATRRPRALVHARRRRRRDARVPRPQRLPARARRLRSRRDPGARRRGRACARRCDGRRRRLVVGDAGRRHRGVLPADLPRPVVGPDRRPRRRCTSSPPGRARR